MRDLQKEKPDFAFPLNKVGVKDIDYPLVVLDKENQEQHTVAKVNMYVNLPHTYRGTHMSRFIEILKKYRGKITFKQIRHLLQDMKETFDAECAHIELDFPYFIEKTAPVSGQKSLLKYGVKFDARLGDKYHFILNVSVPVLTLCPCSKEISEYGAHNQRSIINISIESKGLYWIEDLVKIGEDATSSEIFSLLKRSDEKLITEKAYDNPMFVEDVVRKIAEQLDKDENIKWFSVGVESFESIHNHSAFAYYEKE